MSQHPKPTITGPLFANARSTNPSTSHEAARKVEKTGKAGTQRAAIAAFLKDAEEPMTSEEIADAMGVDRYTPSRRLPELERRGIVRRCAQRGCRVRGSLMVTREHAG